MTTNPPDACRLMAEQIWDTVKPRVCSLDEKKWIAAIADAIRGHTAYPEMVRVLEKALSALYGNKRDKANATWSIHNVLAKTKGVKP